MREIVKAGCVLSFTAFLIAFVLAAVNHATKNIITENEKAEKHKVMSQLLDVGENGYFSPDNLTENIQGVVCFNIGYNYNGGEIGRVFTVAVNGYGGIINVLAGINLDGTVNGVSLGKNTETPGLGTKAGDNKFTSQFMGKSGPFNVVTGKAEKENAVEAVTSATVSSKAVASGVNEAIDYYKMCKTEFLDTIKNN